VPFVTSFPSVGAYRRRGVSHDVGREDLHRIYGSKFYGRVTFGESSRPNSRSATARARTVGERREQRSSATSPTILKLKRTTFNVCLVRLQSCKPPQRDSPPVHDRTHGVATARCAHISEHVISSLCDMPELRATMRGYSIQL
jgi:hypothetical protein